MADLKISALPASTTPLAGTEVLPVVQSGSTKQVSVANLTAGRTVATGALNVSGDETITGAVRAQLKMYGNFAGGTDVGKIQFYNAASEFLAQISVNNTTGAAGDTSYMELWVESAGSAKKVITLESNQNATLAAGNLVIGTSGKGIDFSATPGTGTSELFADYEEGTFVATLTPNTSGSITLGSNNTLSYTKVGRVVVVNGLLEVASVSSPVGTNVQISTLPFTPASISPNAGRSGGSFLVTATSTGNITPGLIINGATPITYIIMDASTVQAGTSPYVQFTYITS
jgi:hypothetical protein